jgi:AraC family transcriptional regulator, regulatory protein of adaptative response / DNA-3-methyladenine glycosylase II
MQLDRQICERARLARDHRFDGLFFTGVHSTGVFCRPICPAPAPKPEHIVYYPSAAAAMAAGLRPCLRCRPEASPGTPAWNGTSATVARGLTLIRQGALNNGSVDDLAGRLGVGGRHLRRLFQTHLGASPSALAIMHKVLFAKQLINETDLSMAEIAFASSFGSIRRFNAAFRKVYGRTPSELRRHGGPTRQDPGPPFRCTLNLPYRPPLDWESMLGFFAQRTIAGVEWAEDGVYCRTIRLNATLGSLSVGPAAKDDALTLRVHLSDSRDMPAVVARVRRMFDLDANLAAIHATLQTDPLLAQLVAKRPGLRLPGAWDPFEVAVRAVAGQQVSVKAARTLVGRLVARTRMVCKHPIHPALTHFFPTAGEIQEGRLDDLGMPGKRVQALMALAGAVARGELNFVVASSLAEFVADMTRLPGIGAWTAQYVAMRALGEPDAFPADDLGIIRALQQEGRRSTRRQILARAQSWRPWRAYGAIHLWNR